MPLDQPAHQPRSPAHPASDLAADRADAVYNPASDRPDSVDDSAADRSNAVNDAPAYRADAVEDRTARVGEARREGVGVRFELFCGGSKGAGGGMCATSARGRLMVGEQGRRRTAGCSRCTPPASVPAHWS